MSLKFLNKEDEYKLIKHYQETGSESTLKKLIEYNQLNINMIVNRMLLSSDAFYNDAIQEATIALIKALKSFDTTTNNRFISYASTAIRNTIIRHIYSSKNNIKLKEHGFLKLKENPDGYFYKTFDIDDYADDDQYEFEDENIIQFENNQHLKLLLSKLSELEVEMLSYKYGLNDYPSLKLSKIYDILFDKPRTVKQKTVYISNKLRYIIKKLKDNK